MISIFWIVILVLLGSAIIDLALWIWIGYLVPSWTISFLLVGYILILFVLRRYVNILRALFSWVDGWIEKLEELIKTHRDHDTQIKRVDEDVKDLRQQFHRDHSLRPRERSDESA